MIPASGHIRAPGAPGASHATSHQPSPQLHHLVTKRTGINAQRKTVTVILSRISRNSRKLLRVLEFLLAHRAKILTANYLLTSKEVWVRRRHPVRPDSEHPLAGLHDQAGLSGAHRKTVETYLEIIAKESAWDDVSDG